MYLSPVRARVQWRCVSAAAAAAAAAATVCRVGVVVCHDGEEHRARVASDTRFDLREEPVFGRNVERQPVLQRGVCLHLLPESVDVNGWLERRQYHPLRLEGVLVERERPIDIIGIWAIVSVQFGLHRGFVRVDISHFAFKWNGLGDVDEDVPCTSHLSLIIEHIRDSTTTSLAAKPIHLARVLVEK